MSAVGGDLLNVRGRRGFTKCPRLVGTYVARRGDLQSTVRQQLGGDLLKYTLFIKRGIYQDLDVKCLIHADYFVTCKFEYI